MYTYEYIIYPESLTNDIQCKRHILLLLLLFYLWLFTKFEKPQNVVITCFNTKFTVREKYKILNVIITIFIVLIL